MPAVEGLVLPQHGAFDFPALSCYTFGMAESDVFREISLDEFRRRHDHVQSRITIGQLAAMHSQIFVEAYSTNAYMERLETAVGFSVAIKRIETPASIALGTTTVQLLFYSKFQLQEKPTVSRIATIHPQTNAGEDAPAIWRLPREDAFRTPQFRSITEGFFAHWVDDDISGAWNELYEHPERTNLTAHSPLLHQRSPFTPPTKREEP